MMSAIGVLGLAVNVEESYMKYWFVLIGMGISPFLNNALIYISEIGNSKWKYISVIIILTGYPLATGAWVAMSWYIF